MKRFQISITKFADFTQEEINSKLFYTVKVGTRNDPRVNFYWLDEMGLRSLHFMEEGATASFILSKETSSDKKKFIGGGCSVKFSYGKMTNLSMPQLPNGQNIQKLEKADTVAITMLKVLSKLYMLVARDCANGSADFGGSQEWRVGSEHYGFVINFQTHKPLCKNKLNSSANYPRFASVLPSTLRVDENLIPKKSLDEAINATLLKFCPSHILTKYGAVASKVSGSGKVPTDPYLTLYHPYTDFRNAENENATTADVLIRLSKYDEVMSKSQSQHKIPKDQVKIVMVPKGSEKEPAACVKWWNVFNPEKDQRATMTIEYTPEFYFGQKGSIRMIVNLGMFSDFQVVVHDREDYPEFGGSAEEPVNDVVTW